MKRFIPALAIAAAFLPGLARADEMPAKLAALTLENDFFAGSDHHYTNGVQAAFVVSPRTVIAIGQRIYTPTNTDSRIPDPADRPYAGWLYGMADVRLPADGTIDHLTVSLGVVGPAALGRQAQNAVHRMLGQQRAQGWDSQIGSEITAMVGYERAWPRVVIADDPSRYRLDFVRGLDWLVLSRIGHPESHVVAVVAALGAAGAHIVVPVALPAEECDELRSAA